MEPQSYTYIDPRASTLPVRKLLNIAIAVLSVLCLFLLFLRFFGYGTVHLNVPSDATVYVNGHQIHTTSVRLRLGQYAVTVYTPTTVASETSVQVHLWPTTFKPTLKTRNPDAIASSTIGAFGLYGPPTMGSVKWFENNTWLVGTVGQGSASPIALHYVGHDWTAAYYQTGDTPPSLSGMPSDVTQYVKQLEAQYGN